MKRIVFYVIIFFMTSPVFSQLFTIDFESKTIANNLDSVLVINLTSNDYLWVKSGSHETGVKKEASDLKGAVYPNPSFGEIYIGLTNPVNQLLTISFSDLSGRVVYTATIKSNGSDKFIISNVPNGMYILTITSPENHYSKLIISQSQVNGWAGLTTSYISNQETSMSFTAEKNYLKTSAIPATAIACGNGSMLYNEGERLLLTGYSDAMQTVVTFIPTNDTTISFNFYSCTDSDNNSYKTVEIGTQVWMAENLKTTQYANGTAIPLVSTSSTWDALTITNKAYCWYDDNIDNKAIYGALYTWAAAMDGAESATNNPSGVQGVCPSGWHLPSDAEWLQMENYLADNGYNYDGTTGGVGDKIAKSLTSTTGWTSSLTTGSAGNTDFPAYRNKSGFTALPGGYRANNGVFYYIDYYGRWWSATDYNGSIAWSKSMYYESSNILSNDNGKDVGFSVRCVKD